MTLPAFEGHDVTQAGIEIPNAAGGLREAMSIQPEAIRQGERRYVVLEVVCQKVRHEPVDREQPAGDQARVHVLMAEAATFVDHDLVRDQLDRQKARIALHKDEVSGQQRTPTDAEFDLEHFAGKHAKRRKTGCPSCEKEKALEAEEKQAAKAARAKASAEKKRTDGKVVDIRDGHGQG